MRTVCGVIGVLSAMLLFSGCISMHVGGTGPTAEASVGAGLVNGYVSANGIRKYNGNIVELGVLPGYGATGELASIDVWPVAGIGFGLLGIRAHLFPLEAGLGVLFYHPQPWGPPLVTPPPPAPPAAPPPSAPPPPPTQP